MKFYIFRQYEWIQLTQLDIESDQRTPSRRLMGGKLND